MLELYRENFLALAKGENEPNFEYDAKVFERAADWIYQKGGFAPEMLKEQPAIDVINETFRIINSAVSSSIDRNVPAELVGALENNAFIFSGFKTYHSLSEVGLSLVDDKGGIKPFEDFHKSVKAIDDKYNKNYLYAEYNHAVSSTQMAVKWNDFAKDGDRYDLQYRTADDGLVREQHQALHNITLPQSDPFWSQFTPPNGWGCRCNVVQVLKEKYPTSDSAAAIAVGEAMTAETKAQMFRFNPGEELKLFPDKHPYNKAPKEVKQVVQQAANEKSQMSKRIQDMIAELPNNLTKEEKTAIAENNIQIEQAIKIAKGKPMSVEKADKQNANPNYGKHKGYGINCQTCVPAYILRSRGFDITAKPNTRGSKLEYLSRGVAAFEIWKNADGTPATHTSMNKWLESKSYIKMTEKHYREFFEETCKEEGVYELSIGWQGGGGHATVLQRFANGELRYIEPQIDNSQGSGRESYDIGYLCKAGATMNLGNSRGIIRIDNKLFNVEFIDIFDK